MASRICAVRGIRTVHALRHVERVMSVLNRISSLKVFWTGFFFGTLENCRERKCFLDGFFFGTYRTVVSD